jgi:hypothetical protein
LARLAFSGLSSRDGDALTRMQLDRPASSTERLYRALVSGALQNGPGVTAA